MLLIVAFFNCGVFNFISPPSVLIQIIAATQLLSFRDKNDHNSPQMLGFSIK